MEKYLIEHRKKASEYHDKANCSYDGKPYVIHLDMVVEGIIKYNKIFLNHEDYIIASIAGYYHDCIEDARLSFNDIIKATNKYIARIVLDVTDVHEENRLLRHLYTMGKTVKNHNSIIVKLCDIRANALYSKEIKSSMYSKYVKEYQYRKPIFKEALKWYNEHIDPNILDSFWDELDEIHGNKKQL